MGQAKTSLEGGSPFDRISEEITESDLGALEQVISEEMTPQQREAIQKPSAAYPRQKVVLAVHWHPEFIPFDLVRDRIDALYPERELELIIPTQHNQVTSYDGRHAGVKIDCYSAEFNQKVQLLVHFRTERLERAETFNSMIKSTFKYRATQLFDLLEAMAGPDPVKLATAANETGADESLVRFVRVHARKLKTMLEQKGDRLPVRAIKNKTARDYFDTLRPTYGHNMIDRAQSLVNAVKKEVKAAFPPQCFHRTEEVIEEARAMGAGIIIPHPEQFWPILLAEYDVDGVEVWNPRSRKYTEFLISLLSRRNEERTRTGQRRLLAFMGDDTHLSEKVKAPAEQDPVKAKSEIGLQPPWNEPNLHPKLVLARMEARDVLEEYQQRLG